MKKIILLFILTLLISVCCIACDGISIGGNDQKSEKDIKVQNDIDIAEIEGYYVTNSWLFECEKWKSYCEVGEELMPDPKGTGIVLSKEFFVIKIKEDKKFDFYMWGRKAVIGDVIIEKNKVSFGNFIENDDPFGEIIDFSFTFDSENKKIKYVMEAVVGEGESPEGSYSVTEKYTIEFKKEENFELFDEKTIGEYVFFSLEDDEKTYHIGDEYNFGDEYNKDICRLTETSSVVEFYKNGGIVSAFWWHAPRRIFWYNCGDKIALMFKEDFTIDTIIYIKIVNDSFSIKYPFGKITYKKR